MDGINWQGLGIRPDRAGGGDGAGDGEFRGLSRSRVGGRKRRKERYKAYTDRAKEAFSAWLAR